MKSHFGVLALTALVSAPIAGCERSVRPSNIDVCRDDVKRTIKATMTFEAEAGLKKSFIAGVSGSDCAPVIGTNLMTPQDQRRESEERMEREFPSVYFSIPGSWSDGSLEKTIEAPIDTSCVYYDWNVDGTPLTEDEHLEFKGEIPPCPPRRSR